MKQKSIHAVLMCLFCSTLLLTASAKEQIAKTAYHELQLHKFGGLEAKTDPLFQFKSLTDGVHLTLVAEKEDDNLDVKSQTVGFTYLNEEAKQPSVIVFEGEVQFTHLSGTIHAEKAAIDFETNVVLFTGNPKADISIAEGVEVEFIQYNLDTGEIVFGPGKIRKITLRKESDSPNSVDSPDPN